MNEASITDEEGPRSILRTVLVHTAFVLVSAALLSLGVWQLNRADEKRTMLSVEAVSASAPAVELSAVLHELDQAAQVYRRVSLSGVWLPQKQWLWDNRIASGQAGYEVITPFQTREGTIVLVNRGWVPVGASREILPDVSTGVTDAQEWTFQGVITQPSKGLASGPAIELSESWPKRVQYLDYAVLNQAMDLDAAPALIQARLLDAQVTAPWHYLGNWEPTESFGPSRHLGYAVQWFALLATLIFLYLWYEIRLFRSAEKDTTSNE